MVAKKKTLVINFILCIICSLLIWLVLDIFCNDKKNYNVIETSVVFLIVTYYASVIIHELAHFFTFRFFKIKMRAICFFPICFINDGTSWQTAINFNYIGLGGAAVSNQVLIDSDKEYKRIKDAFAYSMLMAPIASIVVMILGIILLILGYAVMKNEPLEIIASFLIFINFIIVVGCFSKNGNVYGDFLAYKYIFQEEDAALLLIYNYAAISTNYHAIRNNNDYMRDKLVKCFEKKLSKKIIDIDILIIATIFINELIICNKALPFCILSYINNMYCSLEQFDNIRNTEVFKKFILRLAYYFEYIGKHESSIYIYNNYLCKFSDTVVDKYRKMQADQVIRRIDNRTFLLIKKNIKPDSMYSFYRVFDEYFADEILINKIY